jgi:hypothetical protein
MRAWADQTTPLQSAGAPVANGACYVIRDHNGFPISYAFYETEPGAGQRPISVSVIFQGADKRRLSGHHVSPVHNRTASKVKAPRQRRGLRAATSCHPNQDADAESYCNGNEWALFGFFRDSIKRRSPIASGILA